MTLCIAWVRQESETIRELVFATDSCLTGGGELWRNGIKLFELPRKDCLLCFAGDTQKAYPLILNLIPSIKFDIRMMKQHTDLRQVLEYLCDVFTVTINNLIDEVQDPHAPHPYTEATFIFGGWNWKSKLLEFWHIYYSLDEEKFLYQGYDSSDGRAYLMIGDDLDNAEGFLLEELTGRGKMIHGALDMEPFLVLSKMARDTENFRSICGALQVAKVYQSGETEFFGVMWQSVVNGKYTFLGRELNPYVKPQIRFIDPDTGNILEIALPPNIAKLNTKDYGDECKFIEDCYPNGELKPDLSDKDKEMLLEIFRDSSYNNFLDGLTDKQPAENITKENAE